MQEVASQYYSWDNVRKGELLESVTAEALPSAIFNGGQTNSGFDFILPNGVYVECRNHNGAKYSESYTECVRRDKHRFDRLGEYKFVIIVSSARYTPEALGYYRRMNAVILSIPFVTEENKAEIWARLQKILPILTRCKTYFEAIRMLAVLQLPYLSDNIATNSLVPDYITTKDGITIAILDDNNRLRHTDYAKNDGILLFDTIDSSFGSSVALDFSLALPEPRFYDTLDDLWVFWARVATA